MFLRFQLNKKDIAGGAPCLYDRFNSILTEVLSDLARNKALWLRSVLQYPVINSIKPNMVK